MEEPLGFLIEDGRTKERLLWAVDTANLGVTADRLTYIAVECNYEESLLNRSDRIPSVLKERIRHSHFEVNGRYQVAAQAGSQRRAHHLAAAPAPQETAGQRHGSGGLNGSFRELRFGFVRNKRGIS